MKKMLLLGGTGIVGSGTIEKALVDGYEINAIGLEPNPNLSKSVNQHIYNRLNEGEFSNFILQLTSEMGGWDVVFDVIGSQDKDAQQTCDLFRNSGTRLIFLSTTLVYSRTEKSNYPVPSTRPIA